MNAVKLIVTIPATKYSRVEKEKKELGLTRSAYINQVLEEHFRKEDEAEKEARYIAGYKKKPENMDEIKAMEKASAKVFGRF